MNNLPKNFCEPHALLGADSESAVLVALSGGADSTALLHMMCVCRKKLGFKLCAAHVNHNIRTEKYNCEAARDENFCRELCQKLDVELFVLSADIPAQAKESGESIEALARRVRYGFFAELMQKHGITLLLTAHNSNDNLETQLFNLCRGSGTQGLVGIPQTREFPEGRGNIVRPLLRVSREDILSYCERTGLEYVTDSTNLEEDYTRNRLRLRVIPELCEIFGNPLAASARLSVLAQEDSDFIARAADTAYSRQECFGLEEFNSLHVAVRRRLICKRFGEISDKTLEATHLDAVISLAQRGNPHSSASLPDGITAQIEDDSLIIARPSNTPQICFDIPLSLGANPIADTDLLVLVSDREFVGDVLNFDGRIYKLYTSARIKNAKIHSLRARSRREGDTVRTGNMTKKVKKLMCDNAVPLSERGRLPLIEEDGELIYVPLCAVGDRVRANEKSFEYILYIFRNERI